MASNGAYAQRGNILFSPIFFICFLLSRQKVRCVLAVVSLLNANLIWTPAQHRALFQRVVEYLPSLRAVSAACHCLIS